MPCRIPRSLLLTLVAAAAMAADPASALFTLFDAATAKRLPAASTTAPSLGVGWSTGERRAAALRLGYTANLHAGALVLDAASVPAFADPDLPVEPEHLVLGCRASAGSVVTLRIVGGDGQAFERELPAADENWGELRADLPRDMQGWRAGKGGDGRLHGLRSLAIGLRGGEAKAGVLELARVQAMPSPLEVAFTTRAPGNLFPTGEAPSGHLAATGGSAARVWIEDAFGNPVQEPRSVALSGDIPLPDGFGWYAVKAKVLGYRAGAVGSYAVIPDNRVAGKEPNSPFGVCCHWGDYWYKPEVAELIKRVGIGWIRDGHHQDAPDALGSYQAAKSAGLCMLNVTGWAPGREADVHRPDGTWDFSDFLGRRAAYARAVAAEVDCYDMGNEPVFAWSQVFGSPRWLEVYSGAFAKPYRAALDKADPGSRMFWEGYPDQMEAFIRAGGAGAVGGLSPHPYAHKAEPEDHGLLNGGYAREAELMRQNGLKWPVWIGEIGFSTFTGDSQHFKSVSELQQAALLVRALSMHFAAGVEKIFVYDMVEWTAATWHGDPAGDAGNCEFHFGLVRKDLSPKPAVAAYANLIAWTKGCRWLGRARVGGDQVHVYAFARPGGRPMLVAWTRQGGAPLGVPAGAQVCDIFGRSATWPGGPLPLSAVPVFISGMQLEVEAIPTCAQLPRAYDSLAVQLGPRYGPQEKTARRMAKPSDPTDTATSPPADRPIAPSAPRLVAKSEATAVWDKALYACLQERLARRKTPQFVFSTIRQAVRITAADGDQLAATLGIDGTIALDWKRLSPLDRWRLAEAMLADGNDAFDPAGNALAAYHALAAGEAESGAAHLDRSGVLAAKVRASFDAMEVPATAPAAPTPTPSH